MCRYTLTNIHHYIHIYIYIICKLCTQYCIINHWSSLLGEWLVACPHLRLGPIMELHQQSGALPMPCRGRKILGKVTGKSWDNVEKSVEHRRNIWESNGKLLENHRNIIQSIPKLCVLGSRFWVSQTWIFVQKSWSNSTAFACAWIGTFFLWPLCQVCNCKVCKMPESSILSQNNLNPICFKLMPWK